MTDPNDMEDPQAGEVLPPMLYEAWWAFSMDAQSRAERLNKNAEFVRLLSVNTKITKVGMEMCFELLQPLMQAALPYFEAGVMDTRVGQADANLVRLLDEFKEIATYDHKKGGLE